ncbi:MAG: 16S rRNA (cytidine(1402)-2'-O)-methyltransferase [Peptococcaceae bacterium]|nr:16S rRNA (cytidine(1402)-2'-O)-methyltransferase [Peptococcaceae bacterium]
MLAEETRGVLYLCATPIGNLEDITLRALRVLREVDLIAAEDTRHTRKLLSHYHIHTPLTSFHRHNRRKKGEYLLDLLASGRHVALVSDAGMPGVSDPGQELVAAALDRGYGVVPIPGPSAGITALVVSGLPTDTFVFAGFLPAAQKARRQKLHELRCQRGTLIFYEAPHRLRETLADLAGTLGNRRAAAARELTKVHEEIIRGTLEQIQDHFKEKEPRGEFTLVVAGSGGGETAEKEGAAWLNLSPAAHVARLEAEGAGRKEAIREVARLRGISRREVYRAVVEERTEGD